MFLKRGGVMRSDKVDEKIKRRFDKDSALSEKGQKETTISWMTSEGKHHEFRRNYQQNLTPKKHCQMCRENEE